MNKIEIIDGNKFLKINPDTGDKYIKIKSKTDKMVNDIEIEMVKIIGKLNGTEKKIELVMSPDVFFDWKEKIKQDALRENDGGEE